MSQYGFIYRIEFENAEANTVRIDMSPTDILIADIDTPVVYDLTGSGTPLVISVINNDQDKFFPVRSKQATIQFISTVNFDITTFSSGADHLW